MSGQHNDSENLVKMEILIQGPGELHTLPCVRLPGHSEAPGRGTCLTWRVSPKPAFLHLDGGWVPDLRFSAEAFRRGAPSLRQRPSTVPPEQRNSDGTHFTELGEEGSVVSKRGILPQSRTPKPKQV